MKTKPVFVLIAVVALAQGVLWTNVFSLFHDGWMVYVGGLPAGVGIVGLVAYSANALPRVQSKRARQAGSVILPLLIIAEVVVLGFANYPKITDTVISNLGANIVSGGASLVVTLALVLGSLVDRSLVPAEKQEAKQKKQKKAEPKAEIVAPPAFRCATCGFEAKSQKALNGHQRKHKQIVGYTASFAPIRQDEAEKGRNG